MRREGGERRKGKEAGEEGGGREKGYTLVSDQE
jgi:hypothetical protein